MFKGIKEGEEFEEVKGIKERTEICAEMLVLALWAGLVFVRRSLTAGAAILRTCANSGELTSAVQAMCTNV